MIERRLVFKRFGRAGILGVAEQIHAWPDAKTGRWHIEIRQLLAVPADWTGYPGRSRRWFEAGAPEQAATVRLREVRSQHLKATRRAVGWMLRYPVAFFLEGPVAPLVTYLVARQGLQLSGRGGFLHQQALLPAAPDDLLEAV